MNEESQRILERYPTRIPIILNADFKLEYKKYLIPRELLIRQLVSVVRKRSEIDETVSMEIWHNNIEIHQYKSADEIYEKYKDNDGFLYLDVVTSLNFFEKIKRKVVG